MGTIIYSFISYSALSLFKTEKTHVQHNFVWTSSVFQVKSSLSVKLVKKIAFISISFKFIVLSVCQREKHLLKFVEFHVYVFS